MPSDYPDWGGQYNDKQFFPLFDQAELAARLGSLMTYDRRGSVIWQYAFEHGIGDVGPVAVGVSSSVTLSAAYWHRPPFSCLLTAGGAAGSYASIYRRLPVPQPPLMGVQATVKLTAAVESVLLFLYHFTGSTRYFAELVINQADNKLQAQVSPGVLVDLVDPLTDLSTGYYFAHLKLVCDLSTHTLVRGILDDQEFDLSAYQMVSSANATAAHVYGLIMNRSPSGAIGLAYVGSLIFTAAEPPNS